MVMFDVEVDDKVYEEVAKTERDFEGRRLTAKGFDTIYKVGGSDPYHLCENVAGSGVNLTITGYPTAEVLDEFFEENEPIRHPEDPRERRRKPLGEDEVSRNITTRGTQNFSGAESGISVDFESRSCMMSAIKTTEQAADKFVDEYLIPMHEQDHPPHTYPQGLSFSVEGQGRGASLSSSIASLVEDLQIKMNYSSRDEEELTFNIYPEDDDMPLAREIE
jgi:hypothetical protein